MNVEAFPGFSSRAFRRRGSSRRRQLLAALGLTVLVVAGCAGPDEDKNSSDASPNASSSSTSSTASPSARAASSTSTPTPTPNKPVPARCLTPTAADIKGMDQRELTRLAASLMTVGVANYADAKTAVRAGAGGVFIGSWTDMNILTSDKRNIAALQQQADGHLMVTIDEEGGRVQRLSGLLGPIPAPATMAQTMSTKEVYALAKGHAQKMKQLGLTVDFAPSADISEPDNTTVIGDRAFSPDPMVAAKYARAFADGLAAGGVKPVVKHFPGHGSVIGDSHLGAVTAPPLDQLKQRDLQAFAALSDQPAFMVGHMEVPGLVRPGQQQPGPSSLNPAAYQLLKQGGYPKPGGGTAPAYRGVVFTDDLSGMKAITDRLPVTEAVVKAIAAGADSPLWLGTAELNAAAIAVARAVQSGQISPERIADARSRIAAFTGCA